MAKIEISDKLLKRAKQRKKALKEQGINKSLFDCATDLKMESDMNFFGQFKTKKRGREFFGGGVL